MTTRTLIRVEYAIALCLIALSCVTTVPQAWRALNTDFANYYVTSRLLSDHTDTSRLYEWIWFQRQKDHLGLDQPFAAMSPLTPFSALSIYPFARLTSLPAKHAWLVTNFVLLIASAWLLLSITGLARSHLLLIVAASYPLQRNLLNGQLYILLLFVLALGLWLHLRGHPALAGATIAIAIGLKLFPILFILYFLRKRDGRACLGLLAGAAAVAAISLAAFGWQLHRLYLEQILPRAMIGESTGPYNLTSASFAVLFHRLFLYEPSLNPHPFLSAPWLFALALPLVQLAVLIPLILVIRPRVHAPGLVQLEWSAVLLACLALSPLPASYHFVLLFLPVAILLQHAIRERSRASIVTVVLLYLAIGFPFWPSHSGDGLHPLLHVPRLYATLALYAFTLGQLKPRAVAAIDLARRNLPWLATLATIAAINLAVALHHWHNFNPYAGRLTLDDQAYLLSAPQPTSNGIAFIAMQRNHYRAEPASSPNDAPDHAPDELSHTAGFIEQVSTTSRIGNIEDAESPVISSDRRTLAFTRETHGRLTLWLHALNTATPDAPITPPTLDVLEASFAPDGTIVFAALGPSHTPALYERNPAGAVTQISSEEARYPAVSPDGRWLAYSLLTEGSWNLRLRDRRSNEIRVLTDQPCNAIEPAWQPDSRTLLFASDCGRAIGQTALYRRQILP